MSTKSLTELTAEIVSNQVKTKVMGNEEVTDSLKKVFATLSKLHAAEEENVSDIDTLSEKPATDPKRSILKNKIICLECGAEYKLLSSRHLALHGLTAKEYRKKYGFPTRQPLSCKSLTDKRKAMGKKRGLPAALKKKQAAARRKKK